MSAWISRNVCLFIHRFCHNWLLYRGRGTRSEGGGEGPRNALWRGGGEAERERVSSESYDRGAGNMLPRKISEIWIPSLPSTAQEILKMSRIRERFVLEWVRS